ncbi:MAG TPA: hypothetical protein VHM20_07815, partial [Gammaproteobacteria bacterium]|nr:hypothetical protein [Gammaproteobacteria bacterium]
MFSPKISQDRASLEILENKSVKTLSKTDQDIFIRDYFWTMTNHLSCIIDESYLKFQNDDKAQSFFTALYKIRKQPDSKDILASIAIFEKNMQYVFDSVDATVKKHGDIYGLLNIDNFCLNLGLMIKNLHPKKNIEHLFTLLPHSPDAMADSKYQFHLRRKMLDNPLDRVLQLE